MCSFDNLNKTEVLFSASEVEELEAATRTVVEAMSFIDWWTQSPKSLALRDWSDTAEVKHLFIADAFCGKNCLDCVGYSVAQTP